MKAVNIKNYGSLANALKQRVVNCISGPLENPFGECPATLDEYKTWLYDRLSQEDEEIVEAFDSLTKNSLLGCICKPAPCHCDIIAEVWKEWNADLEIVERNRELIEIGG
jgi:hypothetical protein